MQATPAEIEEILERLAEAPRRIAAMTGSLDNARLHAKFGEDPWSANDILAHLRSCADVWGKGILAMLAQDHPTLRYVSPRTWIKKMKYPEQDFLPSFQAFARQRDDLLAALRPLAFEGWSRGATFTGTTRGREETVFTYARRIVHHEQPHLDQLEGLLNSLAQQG
jgi:hypothetical protein